MSNRDCFIFLTFCLCGLLVAGVSAQSINGKILGTVTDQNGAVVVNATVNVTSEGTGARRTVNADDSGFFVIPELPVGFYVDRVYIKKDFDLGFAFFENGPDPDIGVKRTVISSNIGPIPFSNGASYRNPRVDELFDSRRPRPIGQNARPTTFRCRKFSP